MRSLKLVLLTALTASSLAAQTYNYPALQTPRIVDREYNFAAATAGNAGTSLRLSMARGTERGLAVLARRRARGAEGERHDTRLLLGGGLAWQWLRANADIPFDIALTGGAGFSSGNGFNVVRIPFGAVAGHTFMLDNDMQLTPFVHPRLSIDHCGGLRRKHHEARRRRRHRRELPDHAAGRGSRRGPSGRDIVRFRLHQRARILAGVDAEGAEEVLDGRRQIADARR